MVAQFSVATVDPHFFKNHCILSEEFDKLDSKAIVPAPLKLQANFFQTSLQAGERSSAQCRDIRDLIDMAITISFSTIDRGNRRRRVRFAAHEVINGIVEIWLESATVVWPISISARCGGVELHGELTENRAATEEIGDRHRRFLGVHQLRRFKFDGDEVRQHAEELRSARLVGDGEVIEVIHFQLERLGVGEVADETPGVDTCCVFLEIIVGVEVEALRRDLVVEVEVLLILDVFDEVDVLLLLVLDVFDEVDGAGGTPERAPPPGEQAGRRGLPEGDEVEDAAEEVVGEVGQAVVLAAGGHLVVGARRRGYAMRSGY